MVSVSALVRGVRRRFLVAALLLAALTLPGCNPEGVGELKPPTGVRPPDGALGRPFGNAAQVKKSTKKKGLTEEEANEKVLNPRL